MFDDYSRRALRIISIALGVYPVLEFILDARIGPGKQLQVVWFSGQVPRTLVA